MADNPFTQPTAPAAPNYTLLAQSDPQIIGGARWFWWIAGLSLVNSVMIHSGSETSFVIGLGFTLVADAIFQQMKFIAFAIDAVAIGTIFGLGWFAGRGHVWAFITGIVLYTIDALIYVPMQSWMPVGFHVFALFFISRAMLALRKAIKEAKEQPAVATAPAAEPPVLNG
ncbi:MAG: hypothetical protein HYV95_02005 [Opitutae bacterium]|nr:hypothetical protein [Opitutae bacterium]